MLFLINGPPRSGKDTLAGLLGDERGCYHWKLSAELKERCHAAYRLTRVGGGDLPAEWFEGSKDLPCVGFRGLTPRAAYISFHEDYLKKVHGPRILGELLVDRVVRECREKDMSPHWLPPIAEVAVSDAGDSEQCLPLVERFGQENVVLIYLSRPGVQWTDNRRQFILPGIRSQAIENNGTVEDLRSSLRRILSASRA